MSSRAVQDLPVPILSDEELLAEFERTFSTACHERDDSNPGHISIEPALRRNAATMGELLRRGFRSQPPRWSRSHK